jgi:uncharacterized membrane protein
MVKLYGTSPAFGEVMETHKRTIVRTVSYRITALLITAIWTGLSDAVLIHIVLAALHYAMERAWLKIKWGKIE